MKVAPEAQARSVIARLVRNVTIPLARGAVSAAIDRGDNLALEDGNTLVGKLGVCLVRNEPDRRKAAPGPWPAAS